MLIRATGEIYYKNDKEENQMQFKSKDVTI